MHRVLARPWVPILVTLLVLTGTSQMAWAHAILIESSPKIHGTVTGPNIPIQLRFNVRVDGTRSRLRLLSSDGSLRSLPLEKQTSPDILRSEVTGLKPGPYKLQWQVLASDGHISSGEVAFTVN